MVCGLGSIHRTLCLNCVALFKNHEFVANVKKKPFIIGEIPIPYMDKGKVVRKGKLVEAKTRNK